MVKKLKSQNYFLMLLSFMVIVTSIIVIDSPHLFSLNSNQASSAVPSADVVVNLTPNDIISSPFEVKGQIDSSWQFECSFMIEILDKDSNLSYSYPVTLDPGEDCNSPGKKKFSKKLDFKVKGKNGEIIIHSDNPSGLPENQKSYKIPVKFN